MASLNKVFLAGNLTRDVEVRYTPTGTAVADLNMAINRTYTSGGEQKEEVCFVNVVAWGRTAELCGEYLSKGSPILVEGILQYDTWQTDAGEKRSRLRVRADRVQFLGRPKRGEMGDAPEGGPPPRGGRPAAPPPPADEPPAGPDEGADHENLPF
ncbi:MAG TPA: single-stranded DNA-binding protein [Kiritimatiellia bacterium]|nr:single-stranded DNA-binding protein [Kiritimatiellia bacterium]HRZ12999.1 single-stranded DNA-binding protein [Kiritimatiellia bacterium]HSA18391.1 single-stranded DNA-binding protein [Kiritimatiellia bacterium]